MIFAVDYSKIMLDVILIMYFFSIGKTINSSACALGLESSTADDMPTAKKPWTYSTQVSLPPCGFRCKSVVLGWLQYEDE